MAPQQGLCSVELVIIKFATITTQHLYDWKFV